MRVFALLSWYDESAAWLGALVASVAPLCDHVIAVDGAYALYPDAKRCSGPEQASALTEACYAAGLGLTIHTPSRPWSGNEVEKRAYMFDLALTVATPNEDWFLIIDGDTLLSQCSPGVRGALEETDLDAAEVTMWTRNDPQVGELAQVSQQFVLPRDAKAPFRSLFRALPGLTVKGLHYVYTAWRDDRWVFLWHSPDGSGVHPEPALDLTASVVLEHRNKFRDMARANAARGFYKRRDELSIEKSWNVAEAPNGAE